MITQDKPKNLFADLNKPTQNIATQPSFQNRSNNTQTSTFIMPQQSIVSGANISYHSKNKKSYRGTGGNNFAENTIERYFMDLLKRIR